MDTRVGRRRMLAVALAALLLPIVAGCAAAPSAAPTQGSPQPARAARSAAPCSSSRTGHRQRRRSMPSPVARACPARPSRSSAQAPTPSSWSVPPVMAIPGPSAARPSRPRSHDGKAGDWSAVIVKDGSPQQIGIWVSDAKSEGIDCDGWLAAIDFANLPADAFVPVESGALVPPPDLRPDRERSQSPRRRRRD